MGVEFFLPTAGLGGQEEGHEWLESALAAFLRKLLTFHYLANEEKGEWKKPKAGQRVGRQRNQMKRKRRDFTHCGKVGVSTMSVVHTYIHDLSATNRSPSSKRTCINQSINQSINHATRVASMCERGNGHALQGLP